MNAPDEPVSVLAGTLDSSGAPELARLVAQGRRYTRQTLPSQPAFNERSLLSSVHISRRVRLLAATTFFFITSSGDSRIELQCSLVKRVLKVLDEEKELVLSRQLHPVAAETPPVVTPSSSSPSSRLS